MIGALSRVKHAASWLARSLAGRVRPRASTSPSEHRPRQTGQDILTAAAAGDWDGVVAAAADVDLPTTVRTKITKLAVTAGQPRVVHALESGKEDPLVKARRLGKAFENAGEWVDAAVAYQEAHALDPDEEKTTKRFNLMRLKAPHWGFYASNPQYAWDIAEYPTIAEVGLVGRIDDGYIAGWVPATTGRDTAVAILLNGTPIAHTHATTRVTLPDGHDYLEFTRSVGAILPYVGAGDALVVESGGAKLPIVGTGTRFEFSGGESQTNVLLDKLRDGFVLNKYGQLRKSILVDREWQLGMFDLYAQLRRDLADQLGVELFPFYGTMLGAVREHDFIGHDNDFDTVYISPHSTPEEVRKQFVAICHVLISLGYLLRVKKTHTQVRLPNTSHKLDIFYSWFNTNDEFQVSYVQHGSPVRRSPEFFQFRLERLGRLEIPVPLNAEALLAQLYGEHWRTPDPGFSHKAASGVVEPAYHLTPREINELHWSQFYRDHAIDGPSPFAQEVASRFDKTGTLIELGCGSGRDSIYFGSRGWQVWAADRSPEAIAVTEHATKSAGLQQIKLECLDVASYDDLRSFLTRASTATEAELVVYLRFFLHAIDEETEATVLRALTQAMPRSFTLCAEFRTIDDTDLAKAHGQHYRRYIDHHRFVSQLEAEWEFDIIHHEAGRGLSPYNDEDPHVARVIGRFQGT